MIFILGLEHVELYLYLSFGTEVAGAWWGTWCRCRARGGHRPPMGTGHDFCTLGPYQAAPSWKTLISSKPKFAKTQIWQSLKIFPAKASLLELLLCGFVGKMCAQEQFLHISRTLRSFCDLMFCAKISQHFDKVWDGFLTKRW